MKKLNEKLFQKFSLYEEKGLKYIFGGTGEKHADKSGGVTKPSEDIIKTDTTNDTPNLQGNLFEGENTFLYEKWEDRQKNVEGPIEP